MSWLRTIIERRGRSVEGISPRDPSYWVVKLFGGGGPSSSGVDVTPEKALAWTALSAGLRISAETLGSLPWSVYEQDGRSRIERTTHPVHYLLHNEPNEEMTPMEFFETAQAHALWWGGSPSQIVRNNAGQIMEIWPMHPDRCRWERDRAGKLWMRVTLPSGDGSGGVSGSTMLPAEDVLWIRGFSTGGILGALLPDWHREAIGLGLVSELFVGGFFGRGANAGGILKHPKVLSKEAQSRLRDSIDNQVTGIDRAHRTLILEEGMEFVQTTIDPEKSQLVELRQFQVREASRILRIPPHLLGDLAQATFSNIEHQAIEFVQHHVRPWVTRWEQRFNKQLFGRKERGRVYVKASIDALLRGDMKSRMEAIVMAIQNRLYTPNEGRALLDMNPGPAILDEFQRTPNLSAPSEVAPPPAPASSAPKEEPDETDDRAAA